MGEGREISNFDCHSMSSRRVRVEDSNNFRVSHYILEEHPAAADVVEDGLHDPARADETAAAGAPSSSILSTN